MSPAARLNPSFCFFLRASVPPCLRVKNSLVCLLQKLTGSHGGFWGMPGAFRISHGGTEARRHGDKGIGNTHGQQCLSALLTAPEFLSEIFTGESRQ